jgi:hypothetical protein
MKIPENIVRHIQEEASRVHHGKIVIELNEDKDKIDVVTEHRERFKKDKPGKKDEKTGTFFRKG